MNIDHTFFLYFRMSCKCSKSKKNITILHIFLLHNDLLWHSHDNAFSVEHFSIRTLFWCTYLYFFHEYFIIIHVQVNNVQHALIWKFSDRYNTFSFTFDWTFEIHFKRNYNFVIITRKKVYSILTCSSWGWRVNEFIYSNCFHSIFWQLFDLTFIMRLEKNIFVIYLAVMFDLSLGKFKSILYIKHDHLENECRHTRLWSI